MSEEIKNFFVSLNEKLQNNCFVSGTYIFEGDEMFNFLCDKNPTPRIGQGRLLNMKPKTHNLHIFNTLFKAHKLNNHENVYLVKNNQDYKNQFKSYKQYEIDLQQNALQYPCNSSLCNTKKGSGYIDNDYYNINTDIDEVIPEVMDDEGTQESFDEHLKKHNSSMNETEVYCKLNKETKKCCLFYRFHVNIINIVYTYTFVKLEISPTIQIQDAFEHAVHAAKHYFSRNGTNRSNTWTIRREDIAVYSTINNNNNIISYIHSFKPSQIKKCIFSKVQCPNDNTSFKPRLSKNSDLFKDVRLPYTKTTNNVLPLYSSFDDDNTLFGSNDESLIRYNAYVRTRNEMFIPLTFYKDILFTKSQLGGKMMKTNKTFLYNNRYYSVYQDKVSKVRFILLNKKYTVCKTLKQQTYRKLPEKYKYNNKYYYVYEIVKSRRKFIFVNDKRKYI